MSDIKYQYSFQTLPLTLLPVSVGQGGGGGGLVVYQYTRNEFAKIPRNSQNSSKYTQNYTQVYFIPEIQRKWYTEYPYPGQVVDGTALLSFWYVAVFRKELNL